jgi:glyoxylase-like metal-dependent hydrolase (beta-lactamase superfamily II)
MKIATTAAFTAIAFASAAFAQGKGVERLYILECGQGHTGDMSRWTPGQNVNVPKDIVDNCYLIKHAQGYFLWDTGVADSTPTNTPNSADPKALTWRRPKTLAAQLSELGVKPDDVKYVAVSHTHPDHIGNVEEFPKAMLLVQKAEYEWPDASGKPRFNPAHPVTKLEGDHDVFGDGSATIISTPGHTPGHQSLLVKLTKTGARLLSGDAVHFQSNWEGRRSRLQLRSGEVRDVDDAYGRHAGQGARRDLDQSRQAAARVAQARAGFLRITHGGKGGLASGLVRAYSRLDPAALAVECRASRADHGELPALLSRRFRGRHAAATEAIWG